MSSTFFFPEGVEIPPLNPADCCTCLDRVEILSLNPADCCTCLHHICIKEGDFCEFLINPNDFAECVFCQYYEPKNYEP